MAQVGTLVHTDECQTVINARGRDRKSRARAEREGVVHHNCSCCAKCRAAANQADSYRQAGHVTNQWQSSLKLSSSLHTACPCSSLIPPPLLTGTSTVMAVMAEPHANIHAVQEPWAETRQLSLLTDVEELSKLCTLLQHDARMMHAACCAAHSEGAEWRVQTLSEYRYWSERWHMHTEETSSFSREEEVQTAFWGGLFKL